MIALVVAMDRNGVIGAGGTMPWHLPADLAHFRRLTKGHTVVMGRKTYRSIGSPLKHRHNIVLTRDRTFAADGCEILHDVQEILRRPEPLYVIGGAEIYREFLPYADLLHITRVDAEVEGDTVFPAFDRQEWERTEATERPADEKNAYNCRFETWRRRV